MTELTRYEVILLAVPEVTQDESTLIEKSLTESISKQSASLVSFERWGKYRLAYPVQKKEYGVYFLVRFETDQAAEPLIEELKSLFRIKLHTLVMRHLITVLDAQDSLMYERPLSLEEAPASDMSKFLTEDTTRGRRAPYKDRRSAYGQDQQTIKDDRGRPERMYDDQDETHDLGGE